MMSIIRMILALFILQLMASCQVKEASSSGGGMISDHVPATNKFTAQTPTSGTYVESDTITFNISFPFDIIADMTGGNPRLRLTIGATTQYATYVAQSNPRILQFTYVVAAGDNDTDGVTANALELNGSILQFDNLGVVTNCDVTTLAAKTFTSVKVDTAGPTVTAFTLANIPGLYREGDRINFSMTFSEKVVVTGSPTFPVTLATGGSVDATYDSGSGTNTLGFSFIIDDTLADSNGYNGITSPLDLTSATIQDAVGNDANPDFSAYIAAVLTYSSTVDINGQYPYVINVAVPPNGTYLSAQSLDFVLEFNRPVTVSGTPYIDVVIGSNTRQAQYLSGTGTELITFRYTTVPGDVDPDGIVVDDTIIQNSGNIVGAAAPVVSYFDPVNNLLTIPNTSGIILNSIQPQPITVSRNIDSTLPVWGGTTADNVWIIDQELNITVGFNTNILVTQTNGTPSINLTIGANVREATYLSGGDGQTSLVFRYLIQEGDLDSDGTIALGNINLNGGVITDMSLTNSLLTLPVTSLTTTSVDGIRPTISTVTPPADGTYSAVAPLNQSAMDFTVTWSEDVNYSGTAVGEAVITLDIGGTLVNADAITGTNTAVMVHSPRSLAGRNCNSFNACTGIVVSSPFSGTAEVKDQAGNLANIFTFSAPDGTGILVDTTAPTVDSIVPVDLVATIYTAGDFIDFTVDFNEPVTVLKNATHPRIQIDIGGVTELLLPVSDGTSEIHTFRYTVQAGDLDTDGMAFIDNRVVSNGTTAYARDAGRNNVTGTFTIPSTTHLTVDAVGPTIIDPPVVSAAGSYVSGDTIQISVTFSEDIVVDTGGGTPYITVDFDEGTDNLPLTSSTADTLIFSRTIDLTYFDMTGLPSSITGITLNGATIEDAVGNAGDEIFPSAIDLSGHYVTFSQVKLWVKTPFVNLAPAGVAVVDNGAIVSTEPCGSGTCRTFDGDDELTLSADILDIDMVYMALKTPDTVTGDNYNLMNTHIQMISDTVSNRFDYSTFNGQILIDGVLSGSPHTHNSDTFPGVGSVLYVDFNSGRTITGTLIPSTFIGGIGEVIAAQSGLTADQKIKIRTYIENKY